MRFLSLWYNKYLKNDMMNHPTINKLLFLWYSTVLIKNSTKTLLFTVNVFFFPPPKYRTLWRSTQVINYYVKHCSFMIVVSKLEVKSLNEALICVYRVPIGIHTVHNKASALKKYECRMQKLRSNENIHS